MSDNSQPLQTKYLQDTGVVAGLIQPSLAVLAVIAGLSGYFLGAQWHVHLHHLITLLLGLICLSLAAGILNSYRSKPAHAKIRRNHEDKPDAKLVFSYILLLTAAGLILMLITGKVPFYLSLIAGLTVLMSNLLKRRFVYSAACRALAGSLPILAGYCIGKTGFAAGSCLLLGLTWCLLLAYFMAGATRSQTLQGLTVRPGSKELEQLVVAVRWLIIFTIVLGLALVLFGYIGYSYLVILIPVSGYWLNLTYKYTDDSELADGFSGLRRTARLVLALAVVMLPVSILIP